MNFVNLTNLTQYTYDDFTNKLSIIQGSIYIPIFCAGIANNILTILIILLNQDMRTVTNCYLLNLAISDTLPLIVSLPFEISFLPVEVPWGHLGCRLRALFAETSTNTSILTISAFTIERYLAVCRPLRNTSVSTIRRAIRIQIIIWFLAILSSTPYFYLTKNVYHQCTFDENLRFYVTLCFDISATFFFVLPACILCLLYALMAQRLYNIGLSKDQVNWSSGTRRLNSCSFAMDIQHNNHHQFRKSYRSQRHASTPTLILTRPSILRSENFSSPGLKLHIQSMKRSAFKMLFAVVIAFIICYAPFHVQRLITSRLDVSHLSLIQQRAITIFYFISGIFYYIGSTVNPVFYHLFSRKYRLACIRTMKRMIHCQNRRRCHQTQAKTQKISREQNQARTTKITETIFRSPKRVKVNEDLTNAKRNMLRVSMPGYILSRTCQ